MKKFLLYPSVFLIIFGVSMAMAQKPRPWHGQIIPGKIILPAPRILLPPPGKVFHNYPRKLLVKWQKVRRTGVKYNIEIDCKHCREAGKWASETGTPWNLITGITTDSYQFTFVGDNPGRVRVRAVGKYIKGPWSPWRYFSFKTSASPSATIKEDCIEFSSRSIEVKNISGHWKIVQGNMWMLDFGNNKCEALEAYRVIRHYGLSRQCFVGRPHAPFEYWLANNTSPQGGIDGEDCIHFDPQQIEVKNTNGRWKIVEGNHWMFDFGTNRDQALLAQSIIKKYNFTYSCFVGRPQPSMKYLRK